MLSHHSFSRSQQHLSKIEFKQQLLHQLEKITEWANAHVGLKQSKQFRCESTLRQKTNILTLNYQVCLTVHTDRTRHHYFIRMTFTRQHTSAKAEYSSIKLHQIADS